MSDRTVAISIGDAIDREMLGFPEREIKRVLFALCTALIRGGFRIAYAGDLRPGGYTYDMFGFLTGTYAGQGLTPFLFVVPGSVSDKLSFKAASDLVRQTRSVAQILLVRKGRALSLTSADDLLLIGPKGDMRLSVKDEDEWQSFLQNEPYSSIPEALTDARQTISALADGCVAMGGKMGWPGYSSDQYAGAMPGIVEEALMFLKADKPFIPFGAFGGATRDIAIALGLLPTTDVTPRKEESVSYRDAIGQVEAYRAALAPVPAMENAASHETAEELAQLALEILQTPRR
jgi:hypothetical protein